MGLVVLFTVRCHRFRLMIEFHLAVIFFGDAVNYLGNDFNIVINLYDSKCVHFFHHVDLRVCGLCYHRPEASIAAGTVMMNLSTYKLNFCAISGSIQILMMELVC